MSDNAEAGIARTQVAAAQAQGAEGMKNLHQKNIAYLNERVVVFVLSIAVMGLIIVWLTINSALVTYGSLAVVIALVILWGVIRIKKIGEIKAERENLAKSYRSENSE